MRDKKLTIAFDPEQVKTLLSQTPKLPPLNKVFPTESYRIRNMCRTLFMTGRSWSKPWTFEKVKGLIEENMSYAQFRREIFGDWETQYRYKTLAVEMFELYDFNADHKNLHGYGAHDFLELVAALSYELAYTVYGFEGNWQDWFKCIWVSRTEYWNTAMVKERRISEQKRRIDNR